MWTPAFGLALAWSGVAANAADPQPSVIEPSSSWTLEGSEERCGLLRDFGSGDRQVQLQIDSCGSYDSLRVTLVGGLVLRSMSLRGELRYGFDVFSPNRARGT